MVLGVTISGSCGKAAPIGTRRLARTSPDLGRCPSWRPPARPVSRSAPPGNYALKRPDRLVILRQTPPFARELCVSEKTGRLFAPPSPVPLTPAWAATPRGLRDGRQAAASAAKIKTKEKRRRPIGERVERIEPAQRRRLGRSTCRRERDATSSNYVARKGREENYKREGKPINRPESSTVHTMHPVEKWQNLWKTRNIFRDQYPRFAPFAVLVLARLPG